MTRDRDAIDDFPEELRGTFRPLRLLGAGAMGAVYLAEDLALEREVAVKLMASRPEQEMGERFRREAGALARIKHPNVLQVFDHGLTASGAYIVMELLEGVPLDQAEEIDPLRVMLEVASGLEEIHRNGLVHRDLKPDNILLTDDGRPVIVDFGLVFDPQRTKITRTGAVVGTIAYMAPEVLRARPITPACDWYSWGVTLFRLYEGRLPYTMVDLLEVAKGEALPELEFERLRPEGRTATLLRGVLAERPERRPVSRADIDALLAEAAAGEAEERAPQPEPEIRQGEGSSPLPTGSLAAPPVTGTSLQGLGSALSRLLPRERRRRRLGAVVLALAGLGGGAYLLTPGPPPEPATPERPELPPDLPDRILAALAAAEEERMDRFGSVVGGSTRPDADVRPLLDPDPARWGYLVRHLPPLRELYQWIGEGGRLDALPEEVRGRWEAVDAAFRGHGLPPPLTPWMDLRPATPPLPRPTLLEGERFAGLDVPPRVSGWLGASVDALARAATRHAQAQARYRVARAGRGPPPEGFPPRVWQSPLPGLYPNLYELVRAASGDPTYRKDLRPWAEPGVLLVHRAYLAAARSIREEPETAETVALLYSNLGTLVTPWYYGHPWFLEPEVALGGAPESPAGWHLHGHFLRLARAIRTRLGDPPGPRLRERERLAFERSQDPGESPPGSPARRRSDRGLLDLLQSYDGPLVPEPALRIWEERQARLVDLPEPWRAAALGVVGKAAVAEGLPEGESGERLLGALRTSAREAPPAFREHLGGILDLLE